MNNGTEDKPDILWRLAPWLTLAAMTMTVLTQAPAEPTAHRHSHGTSGHGCEGHGSSTHGQHHAVLDERDIQQNTRCAG